MAKSNQKLRAHPLPVINITKAKHKDSKGRLIIMPRSQGCNRDHDQAKAESLFSDPIFVPSKSKFKALSPHF